MGAQERDVPFLEIIEGIAHELTQMAQREAERRAMLRSLREANSEKVRQLMHLRGLGINGAWLLVMEFLGWHELKNRREIRG